MKSVRNELGGHGEVPHSAVQEENDRSVCGLRVMTGREEEVGSEIAGRRVKVNERVRSLEEFLISGLTD